MSRRQPTAIAADISVLYELSLAIGHSLDFRATCERFVQVLMARKNLSYAAVWLDSSLLPFEASGAPTDDEEPGLALAYAHPEFRSGARFLAATHPLPRALSSASKLARRAGEPGFDELIVEKGVVGGELAVIALGSIGLLKLHSTIGEHRFDDTELNKLENVVAKFAVALEGCLAHARLKEEVAHRGRTEEELLSTTGLLGTLIDNLRSGVLVEDADRRLLHVNRAFCEMFAIPVDPKDLRGADCQQAADQASGLFVDPEDFLAGIVRALDAGAAVSGELFQLGDGRVLERDYVPLAFEEGGGHLWHYRDITDQKLAEEELSKLSLVASRTVNAVVITDDEGRTEWVNDAFTTLTGYAPEEVIGLKPGDLLQGRDTDDRTVAEIRTALDARESFDGEILNYRKDGTPYWIDLTITPVFDEEGALQRFIAIQTDCTERRQAEDELRSQQERMRLLLDNALDAFISMNSSGNVTAWNPRAEETFGYTASEALDRPLTELIIPNRHRESHRSGLERYLETGHGPVLNRRIEIEARTRDGSEIPVELTIYPIRRDGEYTFSAFVRDITERREIERMKDELISTVSHELRTPLTSLRGFVELLREREYSQERRLKFLSIVHEETMRLSRLLDDFLDIQRLESGRQEFRIEPLQLGKVLSDVVELFRARSENHALELDVAAGLPPIAADSDRLRQVVTNLLSNAVKFSPDGGQVRVEARRRNDQVVVTVSDEGVGIPQAALPTLFEKFSRIDHPRTRNIGGSGLGLCLVKQIVEAHGGSVEVESRLGEGSRFALSLPLATGADLPSP